MTKIHNKKKSYYITEVCETFWDCLVYRLLKLKTLNNIYTTILKYHSIILIFIVKYEHMNGMRKYISHVFSNIFTIVFFLILNLKIIIIIIHTKYDVICNKNVKY